MTRSGTRLPARSVAESQGLYDAAGKAVTLGINGAGGFVQDPPPAQAVQPPYEDPQTEALAGQPDPQGAPTHPSAHTSTQQVQARAEYANGGDVQGRDTHIPFGPVIELAQDAEGGLIDPGFPFLWAEGGPRRSFRIAQSIGLMPLLRFAHAAKTGMDSEDLEGMAALYSMIQDCVDPADWDAFQEYATVVKAEDEDLMEFVGAAMEVISARPRKRRGSSSATAPRTSGKSKGGSSGPGSVIPDGAIRPPEVDGLMPVADLVR